MVLILNRFVLDLDMWQPWMSSGFGKSPRAALTPKDGKVHCRYLSRILLFNLLVITLWKLNIAVKQWSLTNDHCAWKNLNFCSGFFKTHSPNGAKNQDTASGRVKNWRVQFRSRDHPTNNIISQGSWHSGAEKTELSYPGKFPSTNTDRWFFCSYQ